MYCVLKDVCRLSLHIINENEQVSEICERQKISENLLNNTNIYIVLIK